MLGCSDSQDATTSSGTPSCPGCNLVLLTFDALRADRLGVYGYDKDTSPNLDALAARSSVFARCVAQAPYTLASVPSFLTSKFSSADRLLDDGVLRAEERTLTEMLKDAGYTTLAVITQVYAGCRWGSCAGFDRANEDYIVPERPERTAERSIEMLRDHAREPFFLWIHARHPHQPYDPSEAVFRRFYDDDDDADDLTFYSESVRHLPFRKGIARLVSHYEETRGEKKSVMGIKGRRYHTTPTVVRQMRAQYDGNIFEIDREMGRFFDALRDLGLLSKTVIIVGADHGEGLGERRLFDHNTVTRGVLHTPMFVFVPGTSAKRYSHPVMNVDILPTALAVLDLPEAPGIRGRNLFETRGPDYVQYSEGSLRTVVKDDIKLIGVEPAEFDGTHPDRLFDLERDPDENFDIASDNTENVRELRAALDAIESENLALDAMAPDTDVSEKLRQLGYIE